MKSEGEGTVYGKLFVGKSPWIQASPSPFALRGIGSEAEVKELVIHPAWVFGVVYFDI